MRRGILAGGVCAFVLFATCAPARAQATDPPVSLGELAARPGRVPADSDIVRLLEVTGSAKMGEQMGLLMARQLIDQLRRVRPDIPARAVDVVDQVVKAELQAGMNAPDGLMARMVPLYAKHFTGDEIRALIAFYESEVGRKAVAVMPAIMQEAMTIGKQWGEEVGPRVQSKVEKRLREEGIIK